MVYLKPDLSKNTASKKQTSKNSSPIFPKIIYLRLFLSSITGRAEKFRYGSQYVESLC